MRGFISEMEIVNKQHIYVKFWWTTLNVTENYVGKGGKVKHGSRTVGVEAAKIIIKLHSLKIYPAISFYMNLTWHYKPLQDSYQIESKKQTAWCDLIDRNQTPMIFRGSKARTENQYLINESMLYLNGHKTDSRHNFFFTTCSIAGIYGKSK